MSVTSLTNRIRAGGFIQSEANFARSRDRVTIESEGSGGPSTALLAGTVLGMITATGEYIPSPATGSSGAQTAVAILIYDADPTNGPVVASVIARDAEVRAEDLTYDASVTTLNQKEAKWAQLAAVGIIVRTEGGVAVTEPT